MIFGVIYVSTRGRRTLSLEVLKNNYHRIMKIILLDIFLLSNLVRLWKKIVKIDDVSSGILLLEKNGEIFDH